MAERPKLQYVVVCDKNDALEPSKDELGKTELLTPSARYTRPVLQSTLQLMGCKPRHAFKISKSVFSLLCNWLDDELIEEKNTRESHAMMHPARLDSLHSKENKVARGLSKEVTVELNSILSDAYKQHCMVIVSRETFLDIVCNAMAEYRYIGPNQRADLILACRVRERKTSITVLLCGTSGCGKSTLSSLLANRLGITTVVSTDSIRHMMRSFTSEKENPLLWASTYHAGEFLDPAAVKEAKLKKKVVKTRNSNGQVNMPSQAIIKEESERPFFECGKSVCESSEPVQDAHTKSTLDCSAQTALSKENELADLADYVVSPKTMAIQGFKAQSEMVIDSLDRLITSWEKKCESVVIEGVHLSLNFVMGLMRKHPSIIPFMIYIANEEKHLERFAVRAKYMTLDPAKNKYVKYIRNIRTIQDYLCKRADKHLVPMVNNTNVDKSVAAIHATIFSSLRRREAGEPLYDQVTNTVKVVDQEYRSQYAASALGSKCMFQLIQRRGSSHNLMALMNLDGSVAKAWPVKTSDRRGSPGTGACSKGDVLSPVFGPMQITRAEHVNLQFGNYGLSAFPTEVGETSHSGSVDGQSLLEEGADLHGSYRTSCSSSPRHGGAEKELIEEASVSVSEEELEEDTSVADTDELDDVGHEHLEQFEMEGSIDESVVADEETEDLLVGQEDDELYWSNECVAEQDKFVDVISSHQTEKLGYSDSVPGNELESGKSWPKIYPFPDYDFVKVLTGSANYHASDVSYKESQVTGLQN